MIGLAFLLGRRRSWLRRICHAIDNAAQFVAPFRVTNGRKFVLADHPCDGFGGHVIDKDEGKALLEEGKVKLKKLQDLLYAADQWSVLMILQAMDAAARIQRSSMS